MMHTLIQVSILDINEEVGQTTCTELQNEYSTNNVLFICCDVSNQEQLVRYIYITNKCYYYDFHKF